MIRRLVFWLAFAGLLALLGYGLSSARLFEQQIWTRTGLERLAWFGAIYAAWALLAWLLLPRRFAQATIVAALVLVTASAGAQAPAAVVFFLLSSLALGGLLAVEGLLGLLVGMALHAWVIGLAVHLPVNYPLVYAAWFAVPIVLQRRRIWENRTVIVAWLRPAQDGRRRMLPAALLGLILLMHLLVALGPEVSADGLAVHLAIPASIETHHRWVFDVRHTAWAVMPMGADWCFTAVYLLGGEAATRLFNFAMLLLVVALLGKLLGRLASPEARLLLMALFASTPLVQLVTGSLFVENYWAAILCGAFLALVRYHESGHARYALVAAALLGTGMATKFGSLAYGLPAGVFLGMELRRRRAIRLAPALAALFLIPGAPPYLKAYLQTGNPVFPFLNTIFRSPYFDFQADLADARYQIPLTGATPYDVTFHTSRYLEAQDGAVGFHYLLFLPLALVMLRRRSSYLEWAALGVSIPFTVMTWATQTNARYLYPALPLFMLLAAGVMAAAREASLVRHRALAAAAVALFFLNTWFLPASGWYHKGFFVNRLLDPSGWDRYLETSAPARQLVTWLNGNHPGKPVVFIETGQTPGLQGRAFTTTWHHANFHRRLVAAAYEEDCLRLMQELGVVLFVAPSDPRLVSRPAVRAFLARFTRSEYQHGGWRVASLREEFSPLLRQAASPGSYDDTDLVISYWGDWTGGRQFDKAANGTVTFSNRRGDWFRFVFEGSDVTWFYTKALNRGRAEVFLDGASRGVVDLYSRATVWQARAVYTGLGRGMHTLEVRVLGEKDPAATDSFVDVDLLLVR